MLWYVIHCPKKDSAKKYSVRKTRKQAKSSHRNQQFRRSKEARHDNYFVETPHEQINAHILENAKETKRKEWNNDMNDKKKRKQRKLKSTSPEKKISTNGHHLFFTSRTALLKDITHLTSTVLSLPLKKLNSQN